jgi:hypothetical protein
MQALIAEFDPINFSHVPFTLAEKQVMWKGLKFLITPHNQPSTSHILNATLQLKRKFNIISMFKHKPKRPLDPFYVKDPSWHPDEHPDIDIFINNVQHDMINTYEHALFGHKSFPNDNLSLQEKDAAASLLTNKDRAIVMGDKNMGAMGVPREWIDIALKYYITKEASVKEITASQVEDVVNDFREYVKTSGFGDKIKGYLLQDSGDLVVPHVFNLAKAHKLTQELFSQLVEGSAPLKSLLSRGIVANYKWINKRAELYLLQLVQPIIDAKPRILKGTKELIIDIERLVLDTSTKWCLLTFDVVHFYPSIDVNEVATILEGILKSNKIGELARRTHKCIVFKIDDKYYKITKGLGIGTFSASAFANLWHWALEENEWANIKVLVAYWTRFIDDGFVICKQPYVQQLYKIIKSLHPNLEYTFQCSCESIDFMDCTIFFPPDFKSTGKLAVKTYQKPFHRYTYIPPSSAHPISCTKGWVKGLLIAYARGNTFELHFNAMKALLWERLRARGYQPLFLKPIFDGIQHTDRTTFLQHTNKVQNDPRDLPIMMIQDTLQLSKQQIEQIIHKHWHFIKDLQLPLPFIVTLNNNKMRARIVSSNSNRMR